MEDKDTLENLDKDPRNEGTSNPPDNDLKSEETLNHPDAHGSQENSSSNNDEEVFMTGQEYLDYVKKLVIEGLKTPEMNLGIQMDAEIKKLNEEIEKKREIIKSFKTYFSNYTKNMDGFAKFMGISPLVSTPPAKVACGIQVGASFINPSAVPLDILKTKPIKVGVDNSKRKAEIDSSCNKTNPKPISSPNKTNVKTLISKNTNPTSTAVKSFEVIDLTEDKHTLPSSSKSLAGFVSTTHPPPFPPLNLIDSDIIPKPILQLQVENSGIVMKWEICPSINLKFPIVSFEIFCYPEPVTAPPISSNVWHRIGLVHALNLSMQCNLKNLPPGVKYHLIIRGIDAQNRHTYFSEISSIIFSTNES